MSKDSKQTTGRSEQDPPPLKPIPRGTVTSYRRRLKQVILVLILITALLLVLAGIFS